ncbi:hypothetical protein MTO96_049061 [Rhipicephalus appendiculatus]
MKLLRKDEIWEEEPEFKGVKARPFEMSFLERHPPSRAPCRHHGSRRRIRRCLCRGLLRLEGSRRHAGGHRPAYHRALS